MHTIWIFTAFCTVKSKIPQTSPQNNCYYIYMLTSTLVFTWNVTKDSMVVTCFSGLSTVTKRSRTSSLAPPSSSLSDRRVESRSIDFGEAGEGGAPCWLFDWPTSFCASSAARLAAAASAKAVSTWW